MAGVDLPGFPSGLAFGAFGELTEHVARSCLLRIDVVAGRRWSRRLQPDLLLESPDRLWSPTWACPRHVLGRVVGRRRNGWNFPALPVLFVTGSHVGFALRPQEIEQALPVPGREGVEIDHAGDAAW